jgi:selenide,water dikinase
VAAVFAAAADVVAAAGGTVAGGHTIRSEEPIFGLAVQGLVHPDRVLTKGAARAGQVLVLSKPIGTGIVLAATDDDAKVTAIGWMRRLNREASEALVVVGPAVGAVTDVTGFGLAGHGWEVAERSDVRLVIDTATVPLHAGALEAAEAGVRTGGDVRNRTHLAGRVASTAPAALDALAHDPQTSGGLMATVDEAVVDELTTAGFAVIGEVVAGQPGVELR